MRIVAILLFCAAARAATHPNFTGTWRVSDTEHHIIDQSGGNLRIVQIIQDENPRTIDVQGPIDGRPHHQIANGSPCTFTARWDGDTLVWETLRETPNGILHNRREMKLEPNGAIITARRTRFAPGPEEAWTEILHRQDPILPPTTCFQLRDDAFGPGGTALARGIVAARFNFREQAERELLPIIRNRRRPGDSAAARSALADLYARAGLVRLMGKQEPSGFHKSLARRPELSVARTAPSTLRYTSDQAGRIDLPVTAAGKPASFRIDTGSAISLLSRSEAARLGLKVERLTMHVNDLGGGSSTARLAIAPVLTIGEIELHNVPFWVSTDEALGISGILGINVLLAIRTLRWNAYGTIELGLPSEPADLARANLCFDDQTPIAQFSYGKDRLAFVVDTGDESSGLFPSFATQYPGAVAKGQQAMVEVYGYVGRSQLKKMLLSDFKIGLGSWQTTLPTMAASLDRVPLWSEFHYGSAGINLLNRASTVTFDFGAMRLTLEGSR